MSNKLIFFGCLMAVLLTGGCGINSNFSAIQTPSPEKTESILIEDTGKLSALTINFGGGEMKLAGGSSHLVNGTAIYNFPDLKPVVEQKDGRVELKQGNIQFKNIPANNGMVNKWNLQIGSTPLALSINAGAYKGIFDLGGLSLTELAIADGACDVTLDFSSPNPQVLQSFSYKTGASNISLLHLGNANLTNFIFDSGAGNYNLDFSGAFSRDGNITIRSGLSNITLTIPEGINASIQIDAGLTNIQVPREWTKVNNTYTQDGSGPRLNILVEMGAGNLQVVH